MVALLMASFVYVSVFTLDLLRFESQGTTYHYVSRGTYALFGVTALLTILLFHVELHQFFSGMYLSEFSFILGGYLALLATSYALLSSGERICTVILRSERCITPAYVFVKSKEVLVQQLLYLVIAIEVSLVFAETWSALLAFVLVISLVQIPQMLHVEPFWRNMFLFLHPITAIIYFYCYTELVHFWPALYIQAVIYMFLWITFSDPEPELGKSVGIGG